MEEMQLDVINIGKYHRTRAGQLAPSHLIGFTPAQLSAYIHPSLANPSSQEINSNLLTSQLEKK